MRNLFKCTVVQSKPVVSVISVWFYGSVYMCFKWLYKKCLMKSRLRRFVDGTWYEDRTNGHALAKVYPSSRTLFHVAMYSIHVYPRALFSLAGTSRPCMTYKRNPFFPLYKLGVPSRFDFGRTGVLRAMLKFVLWLRILMCRDIYHNHVFVIDKDTAH